MWLDVPGAVATPLPGEATSSEQKITAFVPSVLFGYEFDWKFLALRLGLGGFAVVPQDERGEAAIGNDTLGLLIDISVGVTF
jgi:hypothetical protein